MLFLNSTILCLIPFTAAHVLPRHGGDRSSAGGDLDWCGSTSSAPYLLSSFAPNKLAGRFSYTNGTNSSIIVDTYIHVVSTSSRKADGYLSNATIEEQFQVLVDDYAPAGISFALKGIDRTIHKRWSVDESEHLTMKKALRKGDYKTLNLYYLTAVGASGTPGGTLLGQCTFPLETTPDADSEDFFEDGCTILSSTVPGGASEGFDEGKTTTHEVGHWFGLLHTFEGGCGGDGDFVDDTPPEASSASGCSIGRNTCGGDNLPDPINNYMDYSADSCLSQFTPGQVARIQSIWSQYRDLEATSL